MPDHSAAYTISIVEDEAILRDELAFQLECLGFAVAKFESAEPFYRYLAVRPQTVVVLDIGLTGEDGLSVCQYLRAHDVNIGIVFVTARSLRSERLKGLEIGADAYLVKPIDIEELVLILKRLGQRFSAAATSMPPAHCAQWSLDAGSGLLIAPNQTWIRLSVREHQLLNALLQRPGELCSHAELALALRLLPEEYNRHRVEVIFSRLRERVYRSSGLQLPIQAERNGGYRILPGL